MIKHSGDGHFIGIDWGSTNARALLFAPDGRIVDERDEPLGIKHVPEGGHRAAFAQLTSGWRKQHGPIPALLSGMIGSRHGWREVPFVPCPAKLTELHRELVPAPDVDGVSLVPGMSLAGERCDVMRGEELQMLGLGETATAFDWVCIPGTHSKWVRAEWPMVREFHTAMTGEVFAAIAMCTLFAKLIPPRAAAKETPSALIERAFDTGLERSAEPHGLLNVLFGIRAEVLLDQLAATEISDLISGLIIGTEVRHARARSSANARVAVLAAPGLQPRYLRALAAFGFKAKAFDVKQVSADGFVALRNAGR